MKRAFWVVLMGCLLAFPALGFGAGEDYRLGSGDVLAISVWGHDELKAEGLEIRPDGKIALPLAGEIAAEGMTPSELTKAMTKALAEYVRDPQVTVNVIKFRTTRVYVLGEVSRPGLYEIEREHRVLDALAVAGGYTKAADQKKIYLVRNGNQNQYVEIDLRNILKKGDLSQNWVLNDGDMLYLNRSGIDFAKDVLPFLTGIYQIRHF